MQCSLSKSIAAIFVDLDKYGQMWDMELIVDQNSTINLTNNLTIHGSDKQIETKF